MLSPPRGCWLLAGGLRRFVFAPLRRCSFASLLDKEGPENLTRNNPRVRLASFSARHTHKSIFSVRIARSTTFPEKDLYFGISSQNGFCNPALASRLFFLRAQRDSALEGSAKRRHMLTLP